jgi:hypothetical protein
MMMPSQKLKTIEVKGKRFDVTVNIEGTFSTEFESDHVGSDSLNGLISQLQTRMARQKRVNIPFCCWDDDRWYDKPGKLRTGVILGMHGGNSNLLVKFDDEKKSEQCTSSYTFVDPAKAEQLQVLAKALDAARSAFDAFKKKHRFDGRAKVLKALGETPTEEDEEASA